MEVPVIFVFTGTSGSGRKSIAHRVGHELGWTHVISCTTRPAREKEIGRSDYHHLTRVEFNVVESNGEFVQLVDIDQERYGVRKSDLEAALSLGGNVYLILNRFGASAIKQLYGDQVVRLFLYVDKQTVRERLEAKGTPFHVVEQYLDHYTDEVMYRRNCEHVFENIDMNKTLDLIRVVVKQYQ
ncbi:MAG: guanylate kinase [Paenibacillaceae bacterium]